SPLYKHEQQGEVPHIQTVGDHTNPAQRGPLKRPLEPLRSEEEREDAQTKAQRKTQLAYPVVMRDEKRIAEEWPRIHVSLVVIPQDHDKQAEQASSPKPGTHLVQGCSYLGRNRGMLRVHKTERQQHTHSEILEILPTDAIYKEQNAFEHSTGHQQRF
ncbi:MAG TPA: hypothetical protein DCS90_11530, partial [Ktedonobacter sp.]|nr:hypothetical protein [Ktedonobacter sp.]